MTTRTEELLLLLLYGMDFLMHPTLADLDAMNRRWEFGGNRGLRAQLTRMEKQKLIERKKIGKRIRLQLTDWGRAVTIGSPDLFERWNRPWNGKWHLILFDIPVKNHKLRMKLWRWLRENRFGCLQGSVWICSDPIRGIPPIGEEIYSDVVKFSVMEAEPEMGYTDSALVLNGWDFDKINGSYQTYLEFLKAPQPMMTQKSGNIGALLDWAKTERALWSKATRLDPLLQSVLLPRGYLGKKAWKKRWSVLSQNIPENVRIESHEKM